MPSLYTVDKSNLPNGVADMLALRAEVEADLAIPVKQDADPQFINADDIEFSFAAPLDSEGVQEAALLAVVQAHTGEPLQPARPRDPTGAPVVVPRATFVDGLMFVERSMLLDVTPPATGEGSTVNIVDRLITTEMRISGGEYQVDTDGLAKGDRITFAIVDKAGLVHAMSGGLMGLPAEGEPGGGVYVVHKFVDAVHIARNYRGPVKVEGEGMNTINAGFYLRMQVDSNTERADPSSEVAEVIGRFKAYE